jgi:hypothetical protein
MSDRESPTPAAVRHLGRALAIALIGGALAALGASQLEGDTSATSRVAVSDEVGWPFYTAARDSLLELALDPDVQQSVHRAVGADPTSLQLGAEATGGEISVDLTARSADAATATEAANRYAELVVAQGSQEARADAEQRLEGLRAELQDLDARTEANEAELLRVGDALDALGAAPPEGSRLVLESQSRRITEALAEDARRRAQIVQDLPTAAARVGAAASDYEVVRTARSAGGDLLSDATAMALLAGIPLFLLGLGASALWDQTLGIVRRPRDVRWATDAPVFAIGYGADDRIVDATPLERRLARQQIPGSVWMIAPAGQNQRLTALSTSLADAVGRRMVTSAQLAGSDFDRSDRERPLPDRSDAPSAPDSPRGRERVSRTLTSTDEPATTIGRQAPAEILTDTRSDPVQPSPDASTQRSPGSAPETAVSGAVVTIIRNGVRLPRLRRAVRDLELEGVPVEGIVLFGPRR